MQLISIKDNIGIPKYKQIVDSIENAIVNKVLVKGSILPSVNAICKEYAISRDTVFVAYNQLKTRGIIQSITGKGFYVKSDNIELEQKIFVLFDELNAYQSITSITYTETDTDAEILTALGHSGDVIETLVGKRPPRRR